MTSEGSVTRWLAQLQAGDTAPVQHLWERYFQRLVGLARKKLQGAARLGADEEDVALSAFDSFCRRAEQGRFPQLNDRDGLWRLLVVITARKAFHLLRDERRRAPAGVGAPAETAEDADLDQFLSREPSPEFAAQVADECQRLLHCLGDRTLVSVALGKMEGYSDDEIAAQLGYVARSIRRKLEMIRDIWEKEITP